MGKHIALDCRHFFFVGCGSGAAGNEHLVVIFYQVNVFEVYDVLEFRMISSTQRSTNDDKSTWQPQ